MHRPAAELSIPPPCLAKACLSAPRAGHRQAVPSHPALCHAAHLPPCPAARLQAGVAVRSGHLCTQPVHRHLGIASSVRASPYIYNSHADVDAFVDALKESIAFFTEMGM